MLTKLRELGVETTPVAEMDLPRKPHEWPIAEFKLLRILAGSNGHVYHAAEEASAKDAVLLGKRPLVTTIHDTEAYLVPESMNSRGRAYKRACRSWTRRSDMIIVPFEWTKKEVVSLYDVSPERIRVVNYGVDHDLFYPGARPRSSRKRILYVGQLNRFKGVDLLLKAFNAAHREF